MRESLRAEFVELVPRELQEGVLYVSREYRTAVHRCCCGCGQRVVTPLSPAKWMMREEEDGTVSLNPSIGNWSFPCRSHYWIRSGRVIEAGDMSNAQVQRGREHDARLVKSHIESKQDSVFELGSLLDLIGAAWRWLVSLVKGKK